MAKKKMILDLDTGVDDALALAYALGVSSAYAKGNATSPPLYNSKIIFFFALFL